MRRVKSSWFIFRPARHNSNNYSKDFLPPSMPPPPPPVSIEPLLGFGGGSLEQNGILMSPDLNGARFEKNLVVSIVLVINEYCVFFSEFLEHLLEFNKFYYYVIVVHFFMKCTFKKISYIRTSTCYSAFSHHGGKH